MMLPRAMFMLVLLLGSSLAAAAEPADDTAPASAGQPAGDTAAARNSEDSSSEADAPASLDGESFVPSVQISEDLSVSFPTDI
jgi:hypothetical protein